MMATPQSAFQLPPHLLFPGYHASAAAAAAADAAYRQEMYKHRQSVDSAASAESLSRYTPPHVLRQQQQQQQHPTPMQTPTPEPVHPQPAASPIDVCLGADDDSHHLSPHSQHSQSPHSIIHTPVAIRATPPHAAISVSASASASASPTPTHSSSSSSGSPLSFAAKMQSLSPVSVCSIGGETGAARTATASAGAAAAQDGPMDLSMKTSRSSVHSFNDSDACSLQDEHESTMAPRRKFAQLEAEYSSSGSTTSLSSSSAAATATATASFSETASVKRQKMSAGEFGSFAATNAMRGIFVCV